MNLRCHLHTSKKSLNKEALSEAVKLVIKYKLLPFVLTIFAQSLALRQVPREQIHKLSAFQLLFFIEIVIKYKNILKFCLNINILFA